MEHLTRPEGSEPEDFHLTRRTAVSSMQPFLNSFPIPNRPPTRFGFAPFVATVFFLAPIAGFILLSSASGPLPGIGVILLGLGSAPRST